MLKLLRLAVFAGGISLISFGILWFSDGIVWGLIAILAGIALVFVSYRPLSGRRQKSSTELFKEKEEPPES